MKTWTASLAVFLGALGVTILACWGIWAFMLQPTAEAVGTANRLHDLFNQQFPITPRINANAGALFPQTSRSEDMVLLETSGTIHDTLDGILPQAQGLEVQSKYSATIGLRTRETFQIDVRAGGRIADCTVPVPRILFLETSEIRVLKPDGIDWDSLDTKVKRRAMRALERAARGHIEQAHALQMARSEFEQRVGDTLRSVDCEAVFQGREIP